MSSTRPPPKRYEPMKSKYLAFYVLTLITLFSFNSVAAAGPSHALFPVKEQGKWGYIGKSGWLDILPQFEDALPFSEGLAPVKSGKKMGVYRPKRKNGDPPQI